MEKMEIRLYSSVVEFIFDKSKPIFYGDEGQPCFETGRHRKNGKIVAYMCYSFPQLYDRILHGLNEKPIPGRFSVESLVDTGEPTPVCDPEAKNATFAEIVQWVWEKYYAHLEESAPVEAEA